MDYHGALGIVRKGPDFNHLNDYPKSGRAFWTNIGPWQGHLMHSPILQLSFQGQVIGEEVENEIKKQINNFLNGNLKSVQKKLPRERFSLTKDDYVLTEYLFDLEAMVNRVDAVRITQTNPLPLDWLLIKNPNAIKDIIMVASGVDRPDNWREEAALARQQRITTTMPYNDHNMNSNELHKVPEKDRAMKSVASRNGGIDLTPANINLQTQNKGDEIKFHLDSAMLKQLQNAPGFTVGSITIQPLKSLPEFLEMNQNIPSLSH
jgi:hypothetical protein